MQNCVHDTDQLAIKLFFKKKARANFETTLSLVDHMLLKLWPKYHYESFIDVTSLNKMEPLNKKKNSLTRFLYSH